MFLNNFVADASSTCLRQLRKTINLNCARSLYTGSDFKSFGARKIVGGSGNHKNDDMPINVSQNKGNNILKEHSNDTENDTSPSYSRTRKYDNSDNFYALVNTIDFRTISYAQRTRIVGDKQPKWKAKAYSDGEIIEISSSMLGGKWSILFFYPLNFTFVCPTEINEASDMQEEFSKLDADIYGISVDSVYAHRIWSMIPRNEGGVAKLRISLISDLDRNISRRFGVISKVNPSVASRATYIINPEGTICHMSINETSIGRSFTEILRLLKGLQYSSVNGEVCPSKWQEGDKGINPKPEEYNKWYNENARKSY